MFDFPPGTFLGSPVAFPTPHLPPFPSPTLVQPIAQLRQPYIVTITSQGKSQASHMASEANLMSMSIVPKSTPFSLVLLPGEFMKVRIASDFMCAG